MLEESGNIGPLFFSEYEGNYFFFSLSFHSEGNANHDYVQDNEGTPPSSPDTGFLATETRKKGHLGVGEYEDKFVEICKR